MSERLPATITLSVATAAGWVPEEATVQVVLDPGFPEHIAVVALAAARAAITGRLRIEREGLARTEAHLAEQRDEVASLERALAELAPKAER